MTFENTVEKNQRVKEEENKKRIGREVYKLNYFIETLNRKNIEDEYFVSILDKERKKVYFYTLPQGKLKEFFNSIPVIKIWKPDETGFTACKISDLLRWCEEELFGAYGFKKEGYENIIEYLSKNPKDILIFGKRPLEKEFFEEYGDTVISEAEKIGRIMNSFLYAHKEAEKIINDMMKNDEEWDLETYEVPVELHNEIYKVVGTRAPFIKAVYKEDTKSLCIVHVGLPEYLRKKCEKIGEEYGYKVRFRKPTSRSLLLENIKEYRKWQIETGKYFQI